MPCAIENLSGVYGNLNGRGNAPRTCEASNVLATPKAAAPAGTYVRFLFLALVLWFGYGIGMPYLGVVETPHDIAGVEIAPEAFGDGVVTVANAGIALGVCRALHPLA
ncbi:MAG: hypothetical protein AAF941_06955 [Pseudomonadota bacterium]